ncbi:MAG: PIN domain-containing protein, partial [Methanobrevibacter sp.]
ESSKDYNRAINLFVKYDGDLSFVDCLNIAIMRSRNISKIASFDDNFDAVEDIERIH